MPIESIANSLPLLAEGLFTVLTAIIAILVVALLGYLFLQWLKYHQREKYSLEMVMLQVLLPKDSEVKIEAMEQMFNALHSIEQGGWLGGLCFSLRWLAIDCSCCS